MTFAGLQALTEGLAHPVGEGRTGHPRKAVAPRVGRRLGPQEAAAARVSVAGELAAIGIGDADQPGGPGGQVSLTIDRLDLEREGRPRWRRGECFLPFTHDAVF